MLVEIYNIQSQKGCETLGYLLEVCRIGIEKGVEVDAPTFIYPESSQRQTGFAALAVVILNFFNETIFLTVKGLKGKQELV